MRRIHFNRHTLFSTVLNVTGLTLALSVFMILMVQVMYDWRYDRCYPGYENVYRLEYTAHEDMNAYSVNWSRPMITMMKDVLPQAEAIGTYVYDKGAAAAMREAGSDKSGVSLKFADCDYGSHSNLRKGTPPCSALRAWRSYPKEERQNCSERSLRSERKWSSVPLP